MTKIRTVKIKENESLKKWTWWKVGGPAQFFCEPKNKEELKEALEWSKENNKKYTVLGGGTNVLISDEGIEGLVISTRSLNKVSHKKEGDCLHIQAGAGALKSQVMKIFKKFSLSPAVFLSGLPGDVGGGVVMNAGVGEDVKPQNFCEILKSFKVMNFEGSRLYSKEELSWSYRGSSGWGPGVIYEALLSWPLKEEEGLSDKLKRALKKRRDTQPLSELSCGSVFKNPYPRHAGKIIESLGFKGLSLGGAQVSKKHANFILNLGGAKAYDIHGLIRQIRKKAFEELGIKLEPEVHYMGKWDKEEDLWT